MKNLITVLYYTANREQPKFEEKIIANLLEKCGDLPIISVSQKPIFLGKNICVGDVGFASYNEWRQILIGARLVKTPYIAFAESDFLYPREYFTFVPPKKGLYRYDNIRIVYKDARTAGSYRKKIYSEGAQIADRDLIIRVFEQFFEGKPMWIKQNDTTSVYGEIEENMPPFEFFSGDIACVSFKTENGLNKYTGTLNGSGQGNRKITLPYWGHVNTLRAKFFPKQL
jgi:hypothetical protein